VETGIMLRSILIGLDGSRHTESATTFAVALARQADALLVGLSVIDEPEITRPAAVALGAASFKHERDVALLAEAEREADTTLGKFSVRCANERIKCKVLQDVGTPHERIAIEAQRYDLIVLGAKANFKFVTQEGACDTLKHVLRDAPRPTVVVPETYEPGANVLIAYDGSLQSANALASFGSLASPGMGEVHVVTVHADARQAAHIADRARDYLSFRGINAKLHMPRESGSAASQLTALAQEVGAGLLVMGAYGRSTLAEFFLGSVTKTLLEQSRIPLFLHH